MRNDDLYLQDISDACGSILAYLADVTKDTFLEIEMMQGAVIHKFIVIGEAASNISSEVRDEYPEIDWKTLKLFRNFLVHVYFSTTIEKVWEATRCCNS